MSRLPDQIAIGMSVPKDNMTLLAMLNLLDESIKEETALALGPEPVSENRAWKCGRADALTAFKILLTEVRQEALKQRGLPSDV